VRDDREITDVLLIQEFDSDADGANDYRRTGAWAHGPMGA
jgi:hypothetical protein